MGHAEDDTSKGAGGSNSPTSYDILGPNGPSIERGVDHVTVEVPRRNLPKLARRGQKSVNLALFQTPMLLDPFAGLESPVTRSEPDLNAWPGSESRPERAVLVKKSTVEATACTLKPVETFRFTAPRTAKRERHGWNESKVNIPGGVETPEVLSPTVECVDRLYPLLTRPASLLPEQTSDLEDIVIPNQVYPSSPTLSRHASILYGEYRKPRQPIRDHRVEQKRDGRDLSKHIPRLENQVTCYSSCCDYTPGYDWYSLYGKGCGWVLLLVAFYVVFGPLLAVAFCLALAFMALTCQCEKLLQ